MRDPRAQDASFTDYAAFLIRFKAGQLSRQTSFSHSDQEDLEQELWLALQNQADAFDPHRASHGTFVSHVVNSKIAMILRDRRRKKRAGGLRTQSLDAPLQGGDGEPQSLAATISDADRARHRGCRSADESSLCEQRHSLQQALDQMPAPLRDVCRRVMGGTISSAARELNRSRRQIRNALNEARPYLERAGFDNF